MKGRRKNSNESSNIYNDRKRFEARSLEQEKLLEETRELYEAEQEKNDQVNEVLRGTTEEAKFRKLELRQTQERAGEWHGEWEKLLKERTKMEEELADAKDYAMRWCGDYTKMAREKEESEKGYKEQVEYLKRCLEEVQNKLAHESRLREAAKGGHKKTSSQWEALLEKLKSCEEREYEYKHGYEELWLKCESTEAEIEQLRWKNESHGRSYGKREEVIDKMKEDITAMTSNLDRLEEEREVLMSGLDQLEVEKATLIDKVILLEHEKRVLTSMLEDWQDYAKHTEKEAIMWKENFSDLADFANRMMEDLPDRY